VSAESELERRRLDRGPAFEALIKRLAGIIRKSNPDAEPDAEPDVQVLRDLLDYSLSGYGWRVPLYEPPALHEIAKPLARVVEFLKREDCEAELVSALKPDDWRLDRSAERLRLSELIAGLERLERAASRPWRYPVERGRRDNYKLLFLVRDLAAKWVILTDKAFTHQWDRGSNEPVSLGSHFVDAVVRYLDPKSRPALPKMLARVVAERSLPIIRETSEL
jgi:hypothetical protein